MVQTNIVSKVRIAVAKLTPYNFPIKVTVYVGYNEYKLLSKHGHFSSTNEHSITTMYYSGLFIQELPMLNMLHVQPLPE